MKYSVLTLVLFIILTGCITQSAPSTIDEWKEHISILNPPLGQDPTSMVSGGHNIDTLPVGTRITLDVDSKRVYNDIDTATTMVITAVVTGKEYIQNKECTIFDITIDMHVTIVNESMDITITSTEWVDSTGAPVKVDEVITMKFNGMEVPMKISVTRKAEGTFYGHECWVYTGVQTMGIEEEEPEESSIIEYMEKKSCAVIQTITSIGDEPVNTGYMEPPVGISDCEWELGKKERITTDAGRYTCQVIHLKHNGSVVATIWAHETVKVPIKYVYHYQTKDSDIQYTMTLLEYSPGE
ncbi:MAG: hypothetical protein PVF58_19570 [Candidatus Methanofastidiosia archaeon]|jgi:hypothetical protein